MIIYKDGNLLDADVSYIVHQVNCQGVMGSGIAKQIRDKWPHIYHEYKKFLALSNEKWKRPALGRPLLVYEDYDNAPNTRIIVNFFSQNHYLPRTICHTDYEAFRSCCEELRTIIGSHKEQKIGFPYKIGCGLGGGDWNIIENIIDSVFKDYSVEIYKYNAK